jgi:hypothetical protein
MASQPIVPTLRDRPRSEEKVALEVGVAVDIDGAAPDWPEGGSGGSRAGRAWVSAEIEFER